MASKLGLLEPASQPWLTITCFQSYLMHKRLYEQGIAAARIAIVFWVALTQRLWLAHQPPGKNSKVKGFQLDLKIYMTCTPLATMRVAYSIETLFDKLWQKQILNECLGNTKKTLQSISKERRFCKFRHQMIDISISA